MWLYLKTFIFGPRVYQMFLPGNVGYNPNPIESIGNTLVSFTVGLKNVGLMASPILIPWAIRRLTLSSTMTWIQWLIFFHIVAYTTRSIGRLLKYDYIVIEF